MLSSKNECALKEEISKQQVIINSLQTSFEAVEKEKQDINNQLQNSLACKKNLEVV